MENITAIFVYGTLKTGQCRERCWPLVPKSRCKAWTFGELYDTGPYPALIPGTDQVGGELWFYATEDTPDVFDVLDKIEDYSPQRPSGNLYDRRVVECHVENGDVVKAYAYHYAKLEELPRFRKVQPHYLRGNLRLAVWPDGSDW